MSETLWQIPTDSEARPPITGRLVGSLVASVLVAYVAPAGLNALISVAFMFLVAAGLTVASRRVATQTLATLHLWYGLVLEIGVSVVVPEFWPMAMVAAGASVTAGVYAQPTKRSLLIGLAGSVAMGAIGGITGAHPNWLAMGIILAVCGPVARKTRALIDAVNGQNQDALTGLARNGQSIIWERHDDQLSTVAGATKNITGHTAAEWAKLDHASQVHPDDRAGFRTVAPDANAGDWRGRIKTSDGAWRYVSETFEQSNTDQGVVLSGQTFDVHHLVEAQQRLTIQAQTDQVTNLPNRQHFIAMVRNLPAGTDLGIFTIDLLDLRRITEVFGQEYSDEFLAIVGQRLAQTSPYAVARFSGAEFGLAVIGQSENELADTAIELRRIVNEQAKAKDVNLRLDVAVGVARTTDPRLGLGEALSDAETAVATAKTKPERWQLAEPQKQTDKREKVLLAQQVEVAIDTGQLELYFQEKVSLATGWITGFEALIRWNHPDLGVLSPYRFLDVIELSGHTEKFDRFVISKAIEFAASCHEQGHQITISVNVPGRAFDRSIVDFVDKSAQFWNIQPPFITLELTEDPTQRQLSRIQPILAALHDRGFKISIDDFGTGDSTFTRLIDLPITELKIDRSFVTDLVASKDLQTIVAATVEIADKFGLSCIAEGVEDQPTVAKLIELGCEHAQGYHYSRPIPANKALDRLTAQELQPAPAAD